MTPEPVPDLRLLEESVLRAPALVLEFSDDLRSENVTSLGTFLAARLAEVVDGLPEGGHGGGPRSGWPQPLTPPAATSTTPWSPGWTRSCTGRRTSRFLKIAAGNRPEPAGPSKTPSKTWAIQQPETTVF
ncbi:hypothetical protein RCO28_34530 [Streptomyces sp. LHD-70]|uniref:hypothetical protein n=1 Tax=Streptomyces sp. LHD-70 TaxID=3072140 RepID=UPI00280F2772|nr:hypothetical protein [Streptomyces sp. LHD-70]MDQ8707550.1 hypothetical protein [Streptomyces sp. LHD-70]